MKKFEYKLLTINVGHFQKKGFQEELNAKFQEWGEKGWDLVKMEPVSSENVFFRGSYTSKFLVVFKREKLSA